MSQNNSSPTSNDEVDVDELLARFVSPPRPTTVSTPPPAPAVAPPPSATAPTTSYASAFGAPPAAPEMPPPPSFAPVAAAPAPKSAPVAPAVQPAQPTMATSKGASPEELAALKEEEDKPPSTGFRVLAFLTIFGIVGGLIAAGIFAYIVVSTPEKIGSMPGYRDAAKLVPTDRIKDDLKKAATTGMGGAAFNLDNAIVTFFSTSDSAAQVNSYYTKEMSDLGYQNILANKKANRDSKDFTEQYLGFISRFKGTGDFLYQGFAKASPPQETGYLFVYQPKGTLDPELVKMGVKPGQTVFAIIWVSKRG